MNNDAVRIGVVGAGNMTRRYIAAMTGHPPGLYDLAGIADIEVDRAARLCGDMDVPVFSSARELLELQRPDLVVVATPPAQHIDDIVACIERDAHVLCEKPFVIARSDLPRILEAFHSSNSPMLWMASKYRHASGVRWALDQIRRGMIGSLVEMDVVFAHPVDMSSRWNSERSISGGGVIMDNGPHAFDLMRLFLGPLRAVAASASESTGGLPVEDSASVAAQAEDGRIGRAFLSWASPAQDQYFLRLHGTQGRILVGWSESVLLHGSETAPILTGPAYDGTRAVGDQLLAAVTAVARRRDGIGGLDDAIANVEAIHAAYLSLAKGGWQEILSTTNQRSAVHALVV